MHLLTPNSLVAVTGAAGFLGSVLAREIVREFRVRRIDIQSPPGCEETENWLTGDISDRSFVERACADVEALVICHMAPRGNSNYDFPDRSFDINVKGTALAINEAMRQGCKRVVLISSYCVAAGPHPRLSKARMLDVYYLSKVAQEQIALGFYRQFNLPIAILRPSYVTDEDTMEDKYGRQLQTANWQFVDRRDVASAAILALKLPDLGCETFTVVGHQDGERRCDVAHTKARLGWKPKYDFSRFPTDAEPNPA